MLSHSDRLLSIQQPIAFCCPASSVDSTPALCYNAHTMNAPLDGIRILDLSRLLPGPFGTLLLADLGAEVIKVESPQEGDYLRAIPPLVGGEGVYFLAVNRGKKSVALDLKAPAGRQAFLRLVATADALLEGFRPGTMQRLGLDYAALRETNPSLVYCSLSGYGQDGPRRDCPGHDIDYIALGGLLGLTGEVGGPPVVPAVPIADLAGGMAAAIALLAALLGNLRRGQGAYVDVAMRDVVLSWLGTIVMPGLVAGAPLERGRLMLSGGLPCYHVYQTQDGQYLALGALEPKFWANFCRAVGRDDLLARQFDPQAIAEVQAVLHQRARSEWVALLARAEACCEPVYTLAEALADPQVAARGLLLEVAQPAAGPLRLVGPPFRLAETPAAAASPAPRLGEHTAAVLRSLGYAETEIAALAKAGAILAT